MKVLITGGAGFIGSELARALVARGDAVTTFDDGSRGFRGSSGVRALSGDVMDYREVRSAIEGHDAVVHCAAIAGIDTVIKRPTRTMDVNMIGTANVLRAAWSVGVRGRVVDFSTSEVFGAMAYRVSEESSAVSGSAGEARWVYAVSKLAGEHLARAYFSEHGLPTVTLRPFNVYGPGQTGEGAMQIFIARAMRNEDIHINGDGSQIRAWCYIDDMVRATVLAMDHLGAIGESFNIGNARAVTTIYGLAQTVCRVLGSKSRIVFRAPLSADVEVRVPDTGKAADVLGFKAAVDLEDGIERTAQWVRQTT